MSLFDYVAADERFRCEKCGRLVAVQTKGALGQFKTLTLNELAAFMAIYCDGEGVLLEGYCSACHRMTYFELKPVTVEKVDDPFEEIKKLTDEVGCKGRVIAMDEAASRESKDKSADGSAR